MADLRDAVHFFVVQDSILAVVGGVGARGGDLGFARAIGTNQHIFRT
jgi:hypothetical protein